MPNLGKSLLTLEDGARPEVLELAALVSTISVDTPPKADASTATANIQHVSTAEAKQSKGNGRYEAPKHKSAHAGVQISDHPMTRLPSQPLTGEWIPLSDDTLRRGSVIKCKTAATTCSTSSCNYNFSEGQICKVVDIDQDGDISVAALTALHVAELWSPSEARWMFKSDFKAFDVWRPHAASSEEATKIRTARAAMQNLDG